MDIEKFNPKQGEKYSQNLYRWLRKRANLSNSIKVFKDQEGVLFIGFMDGKFLIGARLTQVLCYGVQASLWSYQKDFYEVVNFWIEYARIGRCAIDLDHTMHFVGDKNRWLASGDRRKCQWCNEVEQIRSIVKKVVKTECWISEIKAAEEIS